MTRIRSIALLLLLFPALMVIQSCKKSSGGGDSPTPSDYYLTATVGGKAWSANVKFAGLDNATSVGIISTANNTKLVLALGMAAANRDTTAVVLIFPQNIQLNKPFVFDESKNLEAAYVAETAPGATTYYGYNTTKATGGSGTITITTFDQTSKVIEGTFSGIFGSQTGRPAIPFTDGKFRCLYTTDVTQLPPNLKF